MKAILAICLFILSAAFRAQSNFVLAAPVANATSDFRTPNSTGLFANQRSCFYIHRHELLPLSLATIHSVSFQVVNGTGSIPVSGNFTLYLQNTADPLMLKTGNFNSMISPMTVSYAGSLTIPATGPATVGFALTTPFSYNGKGLYVAWNWENSGPYAASTATFAVSNAVTALGPQLRYESWLQSANSGVGPPANLSSLSNFRPTLLFEGIQNLSNDMEVLDLVLPGNIPSSLNPQTVVSRVINTGTAVANNVSVTLSSGGANAYSSTQVIPSIAPGNIQQVTYTGYNPVNNGISTLSVQIDNPDQYAGNNLVVYKQNVNCEFLSNTPPGLVMNGSCGNAIPYVITTKYVLPTTETLTGVKVGFASAGLTGNEQVCAVLLGGGGNILAMGTTVNIVPGGTVTLPFNAPQQLLSTFPYYIGAAQLTGGKLFACGLQNDFPPPPIHVFPLTGGGNFVLANTVGYCLSMDALLDKTPPSLSVSPGASVCLGSSITLTATSNSTYTWSTNASDTSITVSPVVATIYSVTSSNASCRTTATVNVSVTPIPTLSVSGPTVACLDDAPPILFATGASGYTWTGNNFSPTVAVVTSSAGLKTLTLTGVTAPCPPVNLTLSVMIHQLPDVSLTSPLPSFCTSNTGGIPVQLSGVPAGGTFSGASISSSGVFSPLSTDTIVASYSMTDANTGCSNTATLSLLVTSCLGHNDQSRSYGPSVFPNPSAAGIFSLNGLNDATVEGLVNVNGQEVFVGMVSGDKLDLSRLAPGIYTLKLKTGGGMRYLRLIYAP